MKASLVLTTAQPGQSQHCGGPCIGNSPTLHTLVAAKTSVKSVFKTGFKLLISRAYYRRVLGEPPLFHDRESYLLVLFNGLLKDPVVFAKAMRPVSENYYVSHNIR